MNQRELLDMEKSAEEPNASANLLTNIGVYYANNSNFVKALPYLEHAALQNNATASCYLGFMYYSGTDATPADIDKARSYLEKSYELGEYMGIILLGIIYRDDLSDPNNICKARELFRKATTLGAGYSYYADLRLFDNINFDEFVSLSEFYKKAIQAEPENYNLKKFLSRNISLLDNAIDVNRISSTRKIWDLRDLMYKLSSEHKDGFYYRGQNKMFNTPLCASLERNKYSRYPVRYDGECRLRKTGFTFYFEDRSYMNAKNLWSKEKRMQYLLNSYIRNVFGYTLTMAMTQQAGYQSEGLDISFSFAIALFFAMYKYNQGKYMIDTSTSDLGVIYRWKNLQKTDINTAVQSGYFSAPALIPTYEIFDSFHKCDNVNEFRWSLRQYAEAIGWGDERGLNYMYIGERPLDLITIPKGLWENSRIYRQKAGLLLRDYVISGAKYDAYGKDINANVPHMSDLDFNLCQDLADPEVCETFVFKKDASFAESYLHGNGITPNYLYDGDETDLTHLMLEGWIESRYSSWQQYGTVTIDPGPHPEFNIGYYELLQYLEEYRKNRSKYQYYFRPV